MDIASQGTAASEAGANLHPYNRERRERMQIGIVGLPRSGKTTIFNAVTRGKVDVSPSAGPSGKPNVGVAKVPDGRLDRLAEVFKPRRVVPAEVIYQDIPAAPDGSSGAHGISGENLNNLQVTDALMAVVRAFDDPSVIHVNETVDPLRDVDSMLLELVFSDLGTVERRLARLEEGSKGAKAAEREAMDKERSLLSRLKAELESGAALRDKSFTGDEARALEGFQFLSAKPLVIVLNAGEDQMSEAATLEERLAAVAEGPRARTAVLCGRLEMELSQMDPVEEQEFREGLGAGESGLDRMVRLSHDVGDLVTFFTGNPNEVRAWTVPRGTTALKAAGKVHSDFERGFIRAEVVGFEDLAGCGSIAEARRRGVLRQEGKDYLVGEGDVLNILFNV